jgi:hypothetical protein
MPAIPRVPFLLLVLSACNITVERGPSDGAWSGGEPRACAGDPDDPPDGPASSSSGGDGSGGAGAGGASAGGASPGAGGSAPCADDCHPDEDFVDGACRARCEVNCDCPAGSVCSEGHCFVFDP